MTATAQSYIKALQLQPHPEGGFFSESYRSEQTMEVPAPGGGTQQRNVCTAIYFLLEAGNFSAFHRIQSDEVWHFYAGEALTVHVITPQGAYYPLNIGSNIAAGETFQCVVTAGCWFGAEVSQDGYSLVGCTVAPGFDFADFEMGKREELLKQFPAQTDIIRRLTKIT